MNNSRSQHRFHFIGIGGIGMSGIASLMVKKGYRVSGSDLSDNPLTRKLARLGTKIYQGHRAQSVKPGMTVVYSSCIRKNNPEMIAARKHGNRILKRAEALNELMCGRRSIVITGAHGKTTTSAMMTLVFKRAGFDPTFVIGGVMKNYSSSACLGEGPFNIIEADESDGSFLKITSHIAIITNIDKEHMEYYRNMRNLLGAHKKFIDRIKKPGFLIYNRDDKRLRRMAEIKGTSQALSFSVKSDADICAKDIRIVKGSTTFRCLWEGRFVGYFQIPLPGIHNVMNALPVILTSLRAGLPSGVIRKALAAYQGTERRYDVMHKSPGRMMVHDYAHHPKEIASLIEGVRCAYPRMRIKVIFQPHRFTRTRDLLDEFVQALSLADETVLTDIYSASEKPIRGITHERLYRELRKKGKKTEILKKEKIAQATLADFSRGDILLVLGAGDIYVIAKEMKRVYAAKLKR